MPQVEGLAQGLALGVGFEDLLCVEDKGLDGVGEYGEVAVVEVFQGDVRVGCGHFDQFEAGRKLPNTHHLAFPLKCLQVTDLHLEPIPSLFEIGLFLLVMLRLGNTAILHKMVWQSKLIEWCHYLHWVGV